tara:strand:- start:3222 stop:3425 length:204 start_codon:yes stop_codon:yes gene_type:complete
MRVEGGIATDGGLKLLHEDMALVAGIDKDDCRTVPLGPGSPHIAQLDRPCFVYFFILSTFFVLFYVF